LKIIDDNLKINNAGMLISGLGLLVTGIGAALFHGKTRAGIVGFGVAHILLGALDSMRQDYR